MSGLAMVVNGVTGSQCETDVGHDRWSGYRTSSMLQIIRVDRVHTKWYLRTEALNPGEFSFQSETLGFWGLSISLDELKHVYFNIVYAPVIFGIEMTGNLVFHFLMPNQIEV